MYANRQNFRIFKEIGVEEHDGDVRFKTVEIWLFRACAMKNMQYNRYYKYSSVIMNLAMGQIPCSTERISSYFLFLDTMNKFSYLLIYLDIPNS